jgi:hypothetical protein
MARITQAFPALEKSCAMGLRFPSLVSSERVRFPSQASTRLLQLPNRDHRFAML